MAERAAKEAKAAGIAESLPSDPEEEQVPSPSHFCAMLVPCRFIITAVFASSSLHENAVTNSVPGGNAELCRVR